MVHGKVVRKFAIKCEETQSKIYVKKLKAVFLLPRLGKQIAPIQFGSGHLLIFDSRNAQALDPISESKLQEELDKDASFIDRIFRRKIKGVGEPTYFIPPPIDPKFLSEFLSAHVAQDILSEPERRYNDLIVMIIAIGAAAAMVILAVYFVTHMGTPEVVINASQIANATQGIKPSVTPTAVYYGGGLH